MNLFLSEIYTAITLVISLLFLAISLYKFKDRGIFAYVITMIIISNIQVLKVAQYCFLETPIALGTVPFSVIFLADNILNEYYGKKIALECVWMGFIAYLFFAILMFFAIQTPVVTNFAGCNFAQEMHALFSPSFSIFIASLCAYFCGQYSDIYIYSYLKEKIKILPISCRAFCSMFISGLIDNFIFSVIAWKVFSNTNLSWTDLIITYVIGGYGFRLIVILICSPLLPLYKSLTTSNRLRDVK